MLIICWFILLVNLYVSCERIYPNSYNIITISDIFHDLPSIFDDNTDSSSNIYVRSNGTFSLAIELKEESLIDRITIIGDHSNQTDHEVEIGYNSIYGRYSVKYECLNSDSDIVCKFPCTFGNATIPITGKYIYWTVRQNGRSSWIRINEIQIEGTSVKYDSKVDAVLQKPFKIENTSIANERFCLTYYWKIFDKSPPRHTYIEPNNLTVYFGRNFILKELNIVLTSKIKEEFEFQFGMNNSQLLKFNVNSDCYLESYFEGFQSFTCSLSSLGRIPIDQVTFFTDNISKMKIFGVPMHYPSLSLSSSEVISTKGKPEFEFTCTSVTCAGSCEPQGEVATCQGLMLLRKPITGGVPSLVTRRGQLDPLWADVLSDLKVIVDEESKLVVRIPKTHTFVGQYLCGCESTDAVKTPILSNPTALERNHFLTEAIFQRNYTIDYQGRRQDLRDDIGGLIELATEGKGGFFHMTARGYTFSYSLNTRVEWTEDGERRNHENLHSQEDNVQLYPDIERLSNWTVSVNRIVARDVYPDAKDNETVVYKWSLPNQSASDVVTDLFRIIDVDKKPVESVRAWVMSKTDSLLHILVFCQHSDSSGAINEDEIKVELLSYGCDPDAAPNLVAAFGLNGKDAVINKIPEQSGVENMTYGLAVNIILKDYSTFYRYDLQSIIGENRTSLLDILPSGILRLKDEIEVANFDVSMTKYYTTQDSDKIRAEIQVELLSQVLLDHLNCTDGSLKLTPDWSSDDGQNTTLKHTPTVFDFTAPKDMEKLNFTIDLVIGENSKSTKISLPNPHHESIFIEFENSTGILSWDFVSAELRPAVNEYIVDVIFEDIGCGTQEKVTLNYLAALNCTKTGGCTTHLWSVEQFLNKRDLLANYIITISPNYDSFDGDNSVSGPPSQLKFTYGEQGHSTISSSAESTSPWAQTITLHPSRKAPCEKVIPEEIDASFEITAYAILTQGKVEMPLEGVQYNKLFPSTYGMGGTYKVTNLLPGREYKIKGFIKYPGNLSDLFSEEVTFITPDEIVVPDKYILKDVGDSLLFNCSAAVGTDPKFQKDVRWLRSGQDVESLPEGVFSRTAPFPDDRGFLTASLSIPKIDDTHAGVYCCAPEPPVEHFYGQTPRCAEFRLIVNDLKLDRYYLEANPGMAVSVTCSTKHEGDLQWRGPNGIVIPSSQTRHISASNSTRGIQSLVLLLPEVGFENEGEYQCCFQPKEGEKRAPETFSLRLKESLFVRRPIQSITTLRFGEITTLTCGSHITVGKELPRLRWYRIRQPSPGSSPSNITLEAVGSSEDGHLEVIEEMDASGEVILRVRLTPASQGRYVCASFPEEVADLAGEDELLREKMLQKAVPHIPADVSYYSAVEISDPIRYQNGEVILRCTGYPAHAGERLEWAFKESAVDTAYLFDDGTQGSFTLADKERISYIMSCFRPNLTKSIANWPGAEFYNPLSARHELYSPDEIEISALSKFVEDPICQAAVGQLVCLYRRDVPLSESSSVNPIRLAMLPEVGLNSKALATNIEASISLNAIRDAFNNEALQGNVSMQNAETNESTTIYRHQLFTSLLVAIISTIAAFHLP